MESRDAENALPPPPAAASRPSASRAAAIGWGLSILGVLLLPAVTGSDRAGEDLTRYSIRVCLLWYAAALTLMVCLSRRATPQTVQRLARCLWTVAFLTYLLHFGLAFHYFNHWSHRAAYDHVAAQSGFGPGLYFNYAFTAVWAADVVSWWGGSARYATRPRWIGIVVHSFMLFIVFNGAVVFATGPVRWTSAAGFACLAGIAWWTRSKVRHDGG